MKKIIALIALVATLCTSSLALVGCSGSSDTPDGMQLIAGGESLGYYFYAPEEWTPSNVGEIKAAYVSRLDPTSVSFTEIKSFANMPEGTSKSDYFFGNYFKDSLAEFPEEPSVASIDGETIVFGKINDEGEPNESADKAKKYTYTYKYYDETANEEFTFGVMQILIQEGERFYIFTYTASMEEKTSDTTYYDYYLGDAEDEGKVQEIMNEFRFVPITAEEEEKVYELDEDGYRLVSDPDLAGFSLYVPPTFNEDYSSAMVSATHSDGSNVSLTEANGANENVNTYMLRKLDQLRVITEDGSLTYKLMYEDDGKKVDYETDTPVLDPNGKKVIYYESIDFGNADAANAYEYSYIYNGTKYRVYQVVIVEGWTLSYTGYVFTYTAKEANFDLHFDDVMKTIEKVHFK